MLGCIVDLTKAQSDFQGSWTQCDGLSPIHYQTTTLVIVELLWIGPWNLNETDFFPQDNAFWKSAKCQTFCLRLNVLTHWGWLTHICVSDQCQAIIWTNAGILSIRPFGTNMNEIFIKIQQISFKKMHLKISSGRFRPFCPSLNVLNMCESSLLGSTPMKPLQWHSMFAACGTWHDQIPNEVVIGNTRGQEWSLAKSRPHQCLQHVQMKC